jgi:hypothetical protein
VIATALACFAGLPVLLSPVRRARDITELPAVQQALQRPAASSAPTPTQNDEAASQVFEPSAALTLADVHTPLGCPCVRVHIAAVSVFAAPSMSVAT